MKKRLFAAMLGLTMLFCTLSSDIVSFAEETQEEVVEELAEDTVDESEEETITETEPKVETETEVEAEESENSEADLESESESDAEALADPEAEAAIEAQDEEAQEEKAFSMSKDVNGVNILLEAEPGVIPEKAYFSAIEITDSSKLADIKESIEDTIDDSKKVTKVKAFDITIYNENGDEIQPVTSKGNVKVTFKNINTDQALSNANKDMEVFHVADSMDSAEKISTDVAKGQVSFEAEHFSAYAISTIEEITDSNKEETIAKYLDSVSVSISDGAEISKSDKVKVTYKLKSGLHLNWDADEEGDVPYLETGKSYLLSDKLDLKGFSFKEMSQPVQFQTGEYKGQEFGIINITQNADGTYTISLKVTFGEGQAYEDVAADLGMEFYVSDDFTDENITTVMPDGKTYHFSVKENKKYPPTIKVDGSSDSDGDVTWTTTITNSDINPKDYPDGYTYTGTLSDNQSYKAGTGKIKIGDAEKAIDDSAFSGGKFTYTLSNDDIKNLGKGDKVLITYGTTVDYMPALADIGEGKSAKVSVSNTGAINDNDVASNDKTLDATKEYSNSWLTKSTDADSASKDGNDTSWTVTINTNGEEVTDLVFYDEFSGDGQLELDGDPTVTGATDYTIDKTSSPWKITFNGTVKGEVTIKYTTKIKDYELYLRSNKKNPPANKAYFNFKLNDTAVTGPNVTKEAEITKNAGVDITGSEYNPATHEITWHVDLNKNKQPITNVVLTNDIPSNQEFVGIQNGDGNWVVSEDGKTIEMGDTLNGKSKSFDIVTKIIDDNIKDWSLNATNSNDYNQQLKIKYDVSTITDENVTSDKATATINSEVLNVAKPKYDYSTHDAVFTATVDGNKMKMTGVTLTADVTNFSDISDVKIGSTPLTENDGYTITESNGKKYLTVTVPDINVNESKEVSFKGHVADENYTGVNNGQVTIPVEFSLDTDDLKKISQTQVVNSNLVYDNSVLNKSYDFDSDSNTASYTVVINSAKNKLPETIQLVDTLGASLALDGSSVALYTADINAETGKVDTENGLTAVDKSAYSVTTKTGSDESTELKIKINTDSKDTIYVLKYNATAMDPNNMGNTIFMTNAGSLPTYTHSANIKANLFNDAFAKAAVRLTAYANDNENDPELSGKRITARVYKDSMAEGSEVVTLKIPINGKSVSIGKLKKDSTYIIVVDPDTVPEGYEVPESVTVTPTSTNTKVTAEFNLAKQTKDITLVAADEDSKEAISATLAVYDSDNNKVTTFKYGNTYTVKEEKAPYGYEGDKSATFTIGNDGTVTAEGADYSDGKLTIYDKKLFGNTVKISTVSKDLGNPIEGAKFTITHKDTNTEVVSDYSGTDPLTLSLPAGEYVIHQDAAPYGFNTASDVTFVVDEDGNITVNGSNVDGTVTMGNPYNNSENTSVDSLFGDTSESFAGKKYAVFTYTGDDFDPITATPVHLFYDDPDQAVDSSFNGFHQQTPYILVDMDNLSSFNLLESKIFKSSRLPKLDDSGNPTGETEDVLAVTSTKSGAVTKITLDDPSVSATDLTKTIASSVVPKKPVAPSSSSANGSPAASGSSGQTSGSSSSNSKATNSALNMKENDIVMGADLTAGDGSDASKGPRLAKTGGFIGTLGGYFAAVACILVGLFLALGKKKEYDK